MKVAEFRDEIDFLNDCFNVHYHSCVGETEVSHWLELAKQRLARVRVLLCKTAKPQDLENFKAAIDRADYLISEIENRAKTSNKTKEIKMSNHINKVILVGNIGQDVVVTKTVSGKSVVNFSIATNETWRNRETGEIEKDTEWHSLVAWGVQAENIAQYTAKGSLVYVEGRNKTRKWTDDNGVNHYKTEVIIDEVKFLSSKVAE